MISVLKKVTVELLRDTDIFVKSRRSFMPCLLPAPFCSILFASVSFAIPRIFSSRNWNIMNIWLCGRIWFLEKSTKPCTPRQFPPSPSTCRGRREGNPPPPGGVVKICRFVNKSSSSTEPNILNTQNYIIYLANGLHKAKIKWKISDTVFQAIIR